LPAYSLTLRYKTANLTESNITLEDYPTLLGITRHAGRRNLRTGVDRNFLIIALTFCRNNDPGPWLETTHLRYPTSNSRLCHAAPACCFMIFRCGDPDQPLLLVPGSASSAGAYLCGAIELARPSSEPNTVRARPITGPVLGISTRFSAISGEWEEPGRGTGLEAVPASALKLLRLRLGRL
jgi:hypothetical protein